MIATNDVGTGVVAEFDGFFPSMDAGPAEDQALRGKLCVTLAEMALGEKIIKSFMDRHGGVFRQSSHEGTRLGFSIELPVVGS
jgi:hypothetical protein